MFGVILVDDERHYIDELEKIIREELPFKIVNSCSNGTDALKALRDLDPDILITDVLMPGMSFLCC